MAEFRAPDIEGSAMSDNRIFSDDEVENKFMDDVTWISPEHWRYSKMPWNTIHGQLWQRDVLLGSGSYGAVTVGHRLSDDKFFAIKSILVGYPMSQHIQKRIETQINEVYMMRFLRSKYVPRCLGCGRSNGSNGLKRGECLDVFMEYVPRGSLRSIFDERVKARFQGPTKIGTFDEDDYIRHYTYDLLKALQYVHSKRVVHGDIKMANILLSDTSVMLADWGGAKQLSSDLSNLKKFLIGTKGFKSPEVNNYYQQGYPSDIFSLGCTVIEMFTSLPPQSIHEHVTGLNQLFIHKEAYIPHVVLPDTMSALCKDFLKLCLCQKLEDRWTAQELLHHPFITNRDKANPIPYALGINPEYCEVILKPPRCRMDPELDDGWPTWRVSVHLRRLNGGNQQWLLSHLPGGCAFTGPSQVQVPARRPISTDVDYAKPLPIRVPDFYEMPRANIKANIDSSGHTVTQRLPYYVGPVNLDRIEVCKPAEYPKLKHGASNVPFAAARNVPDAELMQFNETMSAHLEVFEETNNNIFQEAREEAEKNDPEFAADGEDLFPELKSIRRSGSGQTSPSLRLLKKFTGISCLGRQDVTVVKSSSSTKPQSYENNVDEAMEVSSTGPLIILNEQEVELVELSTSSKTRSPRKGKRKVHG